MKPNIIKEKSFQFAINIFQFTNYLNVQKGEYVISKQLLRAGTSVGANVRESEHAESRLDFKHKLNIALKEINETIFWIDILIKSNFENSKQIHDLKNDADQILAILISIIKKLKEK
ncbi:MAG: hypothetical protein RI995_1255 [Bacteroidota bacterium]|jgi:four helix bundle protein